MALVPTIMRACSMTSNICAMPLWTSPTSQPLAGTPWPPKVTSQVAEALRPILCSTLVTKTPLRSPSSSVSKSKWVFGTKNSDRPLVPGPAPSGRASTRWKMFSNRSSESAEVMKRLTPSMCQVPSSCLIALVRPAPTSEPASGSVSTMVAPQPRSTIVAAHFFCSSVPLLKNTSAKPGPAAYIGCGGLRAEHHLRDGPRDGGGAPRPPSSSFSGPMAHSPSHERLVGLLEGLGEGDGVGLRVEDRRVAVGVGEGFGQRALGQAARPRRACCLTVSASRSPKAPASSGLSSAEDLEEVELEVANVCLVMAHVSTHSPLSSGAVGGVPFPPVAGFPHATRG